MARRPRKLVSEGGTPNLPTIEKPDYQNMYLYYESLGSSRTLQKVATEFDKSKAFISLLSRSFGWKHRVQSVESKPSDPVVADTKDQVDDVRRKLISVVREIVDTLHELMFIAKDVKLGRTDESRATRAKQLYESLSMWGFTWKTPGQFKQLIQTLKEISDFNVATGANSKASKVGSAIQIQGDVHGLTITDD